ncbi:MAG: twin-arginine translocase TatA/TatE family subunit [Chloroflexi bacterium]|jgi:TatA/E family protein of Tat protein translocase|nr:twin-arginine translocase TatA/TatE family subunit [Chloroflexota bacterium]MBT7082575.1 twin-arginine translocase TatA/TatE family subunit [Chloroflexota bacterium]MBT7289120.1 twin-arginine translocase TatA/TatE family subunit [Chloroflexota bacterium]
MGFLGVGPMEVVMILVIALVVVGPNKLPGIARSLGKTYREFKKAMDDVTKPIKELTKEVTSEFNDVKKEVNVEVDGVKKVVSEDKQDIISELNVSSEIDEVKKIANEGKQDITSDLNINSGVLSQNISGNAADASKKSLPEKEIAKEELISN